MSGRDRVRELSTVEIAAQERSIDVCRDADFVYIKVSRFEIVFAPEQALELAFELIRKANAIDANTTTITPSEVETKKR